VSIVDPIFRLLVFVTDQQAIVLVDPAKDYVRVGFVKIYHHRDIVREVLDAKFYEFSIAESI
jgi:hypothetical protein